jgi:hypothetical protein
MLSVVFCTTCKGRANHIEQTLPRNLAGNQHSKFVILDYNSTDHLLEYLSSNHQKDIESGHLVVYSMLPGADGPIPFAMAHAKNMAHRCGMLEGGEILVNLTVAASLCKPCGIAGLFRMGKGNGWPRILKGFSGHLYPKDLTDAWWYPQTPLCLLVDIMRSTTHGGRMIRISTSVFGG